MAVPVNRNITRAEQNLADLSKQLARLDQVRAQLAKQVEIAEKALAQAQHEAEQLNFRMVSQDFIEPPLSQSSPATFESQYDQFNLNSNQRLSPMSKPPKKGIGEQLVPNMNLPTFNMGDDRLHWQQVDTRSPEKTYASGIYVRTMNGRPITSRSGKRYEYELTEGALPLSVGEEIVAPVHIGGHGAGMLGKRNQLIFRVEEIYEGRKYFGEHDRIESKTGG